MSKCSVCYKKAEFTCGHGCEVAYCGEKCAESVYDVHQKTDCLGLIGLEDTNTLIQRINYGSPQQTYNNFLRYAGMLQQELQSHSRLNFMQKPFNRRTIEQSVQNFLAAAGYILANRPDLSQDNMRANIMALRNRIMKEYPAYLNSEIESVDEGVADFNTSSDDYLKSFNLKDSSQRVVVIDNAMEDVKATYMAKRKNILLKSGLKKKLGYFSQALRDLMKTRSDLTNDEKTTYKKYAEKVDVWVSHL